MSAPARKTPPPAPTEGPVFRTALVRSVDAEKRTIDVVASSETLDSHGTILVQDWEEDGGLDRFRANPAILWAHNIVADELPIGRAVSVGVTDGYLRATIEFAPESISRRAEECFQAYRQGFLRAVSVGFNPRSYRWEERDGREALVLFKNELLEISCVPVGSNPDALISRSLTDFRARALAARQPSPAPEDPMDEETKKLLEFARTALAMLGAKDSEEGVAALRAQALVERRAKELETEVTTLRAKVEDDRKAAEAKERASLIAEAKRAGKITPADETDENFKAMVEGAPLAQLRFFLGKLPPKAKGPKAPSGDPEPQHETGRAERAAGTGSMAGVVGLTDAEVQAAKIAGISLDQVRASKAKRATAKAANPAAFNSNTVEASEAEDEDQE